MTSQARETWKKKSSRLQINSGQEMENRSQETLVPPPHLHASSYNLHDASPTRLSVKVENNKSYLSADKSIHYIFTRKKLSGSFSLF